MLAWPTMVLGIAKLGNGGSSPWRLLAVTVTTIWQRVSQVVPQAGAVQLLLTTPHTVAVALRATTAGIQLLLAIAVVCACVARAVAIMFALTA